MEHHTDAPNYLETDRCILRCPTLEDIPLIFQTTAKFLQDLKPWFSWAYLPYSLETAEERVRQAMAQFIIRESYVYHVFEKGSLEFLAVGLLYNIDWDVPKFELG